MYISADSFLCLASAVLGYIVGLAAGSYDAAYKHSQIDYIDLDHWNTEWHLCRRCQRRLLFGSTAVSLMFYYICQLALDNYYLYVNGHL
jgi:ABC-type dipeptide/oligopeptide/nickel transport system permease component